MAAQTITSIVVSDPKNPVEVQTWMTSNPTAVIITVFVSDQWVYNIVHS